MDQMEVESWNISVLCLSDPSTNTMDKLGLNTLIFAKLSDAIDDKKNCLNILSFQIFKNLGFNKRNMIIKILYFDFYFIRLK